jgi:ABC-type uncharacterized transport system ATPase subunit
LGQLSYEIVVAKPLSLSAVTYDAESNKLTAYDITNVVMIEFNCRQGAIVLLNGMRGSDQEQLVRVAGEITTKASGTMKWLCEAS